MLTVFYAFAGVVAGAVGGMGMGGGTILIPALSILFGVEQHTAQAINLIAFIPLSAVSLILHAKNGFLKKDGVFPAAFVGVPFCVLGAAVSAVICAATLKKLFGAFLLILALICGVNSVKKFFKNK